MKDNESHTGARNRAMAIVVKAKTAALVKLGDAVFQVVIGDAGSEGKFTLDLKNDNGSATVGKDPKADCIITMAVTDMIAMAEGKLDGMQAFLSGKLKVKGNMMLAQLEFRNITTVICYLIEDQSDFF